MIKLKFKSDIFFINIFIIFLQFFSIYIKMSKNLSGKYYQENKERLKKESS